MDCLVCHDTTGTYKKFPTSAGNPVLQDMEWPKGSGKIMKAVDLEAIAKKVGKTSRMPYDSGNNLVVVTKLFGGFWNHYDWVKASADGMKEAGLRFTGKIGFTDTRMFWKVNHMVVPNTQALKCNDCHAPGGRMDWKALGYPGDPKKPSPKG